VVGNELVDGIEDGFFRQAGERKVGNHATEYFTGGLGF